MVGNLDDEKTGKVRNGYESAQVERTREERVIALSAYHIKVRTCCPIVDSDVVSIPLRRAKTNWLHLRHAIKLHFTYLLHQAARILNMAPGQPTASSGGADEADLAKVCIAANRLIGDN